MSERARFAVLVPTRERADVLAATLRTLVSQDYDALEIIVSDNASRDGTEDVVRSFADPRLKYVNPGQRLSMSDNWEFALSHAPDHWVAIIGDDDGLLPGALGRAADLVRETGTLAIRSNGCSYVWPSVTGAGHGRLYVSPGDGFEERDARGWLRRVLEGRAAYTSLPMLYHGGFVHASVIQAIRARTGRFYRSAIPDIYSAVAVASVLPTYIYSHRPLAIAGHSRHSVGASQFAGETEASGTTPARQFASEGNIAFHEELPAAGFPRSFQALVYESFLQSAPLRSRELQGIDHEQQLRVILAAEHADRAAVYEWGRAFAEKHGLAYGRIAARARAQALAGSVPGRLEHFRTMFNTISVGSSELTISDVYEASRVAAAILEARPGRVGNNLGKIRRRLVLSATGTRHRRGGS